MPPTFSHLKTSFAGSVTAKIIMIGVLSLLLLIPVGLIGGLIGEREERQVEAAQEIAQKWGQPQAVLGPVLTVPYWTTQKDDKGVAQKVRETAYFLPTQLTVDGTLAPEVRARGIFETVVYSTALQFRGTFAPNWAALGIAPEAVEAAGARVYVQLSDARGLSADAALQFAGATYPFESGTLTPGTGIQARVGALPAKADFAFQLALLGSENLQFTPVGQQTDVTLTAAWPSPKFIGSFLPTTHTETAKDFRATWQTSHFGRNLPQQWVGSAMLGGLGGVVLPTPSPTWTGDEGGSYTAPNADGVNLNNPQQLGVALYQPVDFYQKTERALKYALLFIGLTFTAFFLFEALRKLRIHPLQYILVGFALALFYLLLLALAEEIGFAAAYAVASTATIGLVAAYCASVLGGARNAATIAGLLGGLYGYLYLLLQMEERALLFGAGALFVVLAGVMWMTRKVDWYAVQFNREV